jgi:hypothetical protein
MVDTVVAGTAAGPRFGIGRALSLTFGVLGRNLVPMGILSLAVTAIQSIIEFALAGGAPGGESAGSSFLGLFSYAFITAPVTYATFQDLRGAPVGLGGMYAKGYRSIGRVIGASFAFGVAIVVPVLLTIFAGWTLASTMEAAVILAGVLCGIFILYIVVSWFIVVPVLVMEEIGFFAGFGRALDLSKGRRWSILGLLLVYVVLMLAIGAVLAFVVVVFSDAPMVQELALIPFGAFYSTIGAILPAVVYYLLRAEKEGVGIDDIAKVFD